MTTEQAYETIIVEKEHGRARITLNRPERKAALEWRDGRFSSPAARRAWQEEQWPEGPRN